MEVTKSKSAEDRDVFTVLSTLWKTCDHFSTVLRITKFSFHDLQQAFKAPRPSPLLVEVHVGMLQYLFDQHKKAAKEDVAVQNASQVVKLQNELDATTWTSVAHRYLRLLFGRFYEKVRIQVENKLEQERLPQTTDVAELSVERLQECRVVYQALAGFPEFEVINKACKPGAMNGEVVGNLAELSERLYSEYYVTNNGCNGFAQDFRSAMKTFASSTDEALSKAATVVGDAFEQLFAYVEVHADQVEQEPVGTKRRGSHVGAEPASKRRKEETELYAPCVRRQVAKLTEMFIRMEREDGKAYGFLGISERLIIVEWLLDLVADTQGFRDKVRSTMDDLDSFNENYGAVLDKAVEKRDTYVQEWREDHVQGTKVDLMEKKALAKRAEAAFQRGKSPIVRNSDHDCVCEGARSEEEQLVLGRSFRTRYPSGLVEEGYVQSKLKLGYKCVYNDGSSEVLSATVVRSRLLPTAAELKGKSSQSPFFSSYHSPTPAKRKHEESKPVSRRSSRKRKSVTPAPSPVKGSSRPYPFLYLTIPVEHWVVKAGSVVDTRFGFAVVKEVRSSASRNMCEYVVELPFGVMTLSSRHETLLQVATLKEVDKINDTLLEKAMAGEIKKYEARLKKEDVDTLALMQRREDLESSVRLKPLAKDGDKVVWGLDGLCIYENEAIGDRSTDKIEVLKVVKEFPEPDKLSRLVLENRTSRSRGSNVSYSQYKNNYRSSSIPGFLRMLPGLTQYERYSQVEALRYTLLRLEANIAAYTRPSYRLGKRRAWLLKLSTHSLSILKPLEKLQVLAECLIEIETELMEGLGDSSSAAEQAKTKQLKNVIEHDVAKRIYPFLPQGLTQKEFLTAEKFERNGKEETYLRACLKSFFKYKKISVTEQQIDSIAVWTSTSGVPALDAKLKTRYDDSLASTFAIHNLWVEAYRKPSARLEADKWKMEFAAMLDPSNVTEFVDSWFPVRDYWKKSMQSSATRSCEKLLHFALCLEQNALLLHKNLDFDSASRLFSDRTLIPYPFQKLNCGDIVVYDSMRHEYALKMEKQKCSANRAAMTKNQQQLKSLQSSMIWLGGLPKPNNNGGRIREFQVYLVQYFPGGGEPYAVLTLGPKPGKRTVAVASRPSVVHGRGRTTRFCKMPKCSVYAIDGNFGYCEDHREVDPKEPRSRKSSSAPVVAARDDFCYLCFLGFTEEEARTACNNDGCPRAYHNRCLRRGCFSLQGRLWSCPVHKTDNKFRHQLFKIVDRLCNFPSAGPFLHSVSDQPGYYDAIKNPLCFQDIREKICHDKYKTIQEVMADMNLLVANCHAWCDSRYPDLPPVAERLKRTFVVALKKAGMDPEEESNGVATPNGSLPMNGSKPDDDRPEAESKSDKSKRRSIRKKAKTGSAEDEANLPFQPCRQCGNCIARASFPALQRFDSLRCVHDPRTLGLPDLLRIEMPPLFRLDNPDQRIWERPPGYGLQSKYEEFFVVVAPLSSMVTPYVLKRPGWQTIAKYESTKRENNSRALGKTK